MNWFQTIGLTIVALVLLVGLAGPPLLQWNHNKLVDEYERILKEQKEGL